MLCACTVRVRVCGLDRTQPARLDSLLLLPCVASTCTECTSALSGLEVSECVRKLYRSRGPRQEGVAKTCRPKVPAAKGTMASPGQPRALLGEGRCARRQCEKSGAINSSRGFSSSRPFAVTARISYGELVTQLCAHSKAAEGSVVLPGDRYCHWTIYSIGRISWQFGVVAL